MPPLSGLITNKIEGRQQGVITTIVLKEVRQFRAYCCNISSNAIMGVAKEPVPIVSINPSPICLGDAISWDLTQSYAPGSTITSWEIDFDDSSSSSGAVIGSASGTHTYGAIGVYDIEVTIEEGLGLSQTVTVQVEVLDCTLTTDIYEGTYTYAADNQGGGVYFIDWGETSPAWESRNNDLLGNSLNIRSLTLDKNTSQLKPNKHYLWIATQGGVYRSTNGGNNWQKMIMGNPDNSYFLDNPVPTEADLDWHKVVLDPNNSDKVFILASYSYFY